jgi:hypothetical protein
LVQPTAAAICVASGPPEAAVAVLDLAALDLAVVGLAVLVLAVLGSAELGLAVVGLAVLVLAVLVLAVLGLAVVGSAVLGSVLVLAMLVLGALAGPRGGADLVAAAIVGVASRCANGALVSVDAIGLTGPCVACSLLCWDLVTSTRTIPVAKSADRANQVIGLAHIPRTVRECR